MKTKVLIIVVLFAGLAAINVPVFAHHGAASFELGAPVVLKNAVITEFAWINPHPLIKADFKDEKGNVQHWTMELGSIPSAQLIGWNRGSLAATDVFTRTVSWSWAISSPAAMMRTTTRMAASRLRVFGRPIW